jgi:hypothetical protein
MNPVLLAGIRLGLPLLLFAAIATGFLFVCEIALLHWGMKWPYALRAALRIWTVLLILGTIYYSLGP